MFRVTRRPVNGRDRAEAPGVLAYQDNVINQSKAQPASLGASLRRNCVHANVRNHGAEGACESWQFLSMQESRCFQEGLPILRAGTEQKRGNQSRGRRKSWQRKPASRRWEMGSAHRLSRSGREASGNCGRGGVWEH